MPSLRVVWVVPEEKGGIRSYAEGLCPSIRELLRDEAIEPIYSAKIDDLVDAQPDLIHVQHEFGLFGSKTPGLYRFPKWLRQVRAALPQTRIVATAHQVLSPDYRYEYSGRGWQIPFRFLLNHSLISWMRRGWLEGTWGGLDGVIVHSKLQAPAVQGSGCALVRVIPHYVLRVEQPEAVAKASSPPVIVVFGFISPDKGQDVAIRALAKMRNPAKLLLAGDVRRRQDRPYLEHCLSLARKLGVEQRMEVTGFVPPEKLGALYRDSSLVLAPFRMTSGSGSLALALAHGSPILASDLPINLEISERMKGEGREPGCAGIEFFRSEDLGDCASKLDRLVQDENARALLSENALAYARENSPSRIAEKHLEFYRTVVAKAAR